MPTFTATRFRSERVCEQHHFDAETPKAALAYIRKHHDSDELDWGDANNCGDADYPEFSISLDQWIEGGNGAKIEICEEVLPGEGPSIREAMAFVEKVARFDLGSDASNADVGRALGLLVAEAAALVAKGRQP